ncbi:hypothetical protein AOQ84DRAFT_382713 [Glonium stellatum]|uniref:DUF6604 domain-containing protein n=1 Tax=Glonium stellatum TaxID=574774 RepID=A0A8E2JMC3_9PEZI|nr:hypothetical protein AOQ84DRAFT_382713 [Glonium stellatum]
MSVVTADPCFERYKRYKKDTQKIVVWLTEAAEKCGHLKAPEENRRSSALPSVSHITVRNYVELANLISASTNPVVKVPTIILETLRDVINMRNEHTAMFLNQQATNPAVQAQNKTHRYFIDILEEVFSVYPGFPTNLRIVANDDMADQQDKIEPPTFLPTPEDLIIEWQSEFDFALGCFLRDLNSLRKQLRQVWTDYKSRRVTLPTAAIVTNTAFEIIERSVVEFFQEIPVFPGPITGGRPKSLVGGIKVLYKRLCSERGISHDLKPYEKASRTPSMFKIANILCIPAIYSLEFYESCSDSSDQRIVRYMRANDPMPSYGEHKRDEDESSIPENQGINPSVLYEHEWTFRSTPILIREFSRMARLDVLFPILDELTTWLMGSLKSNERSRWAHWLAFGLQILMDIHHVLKEDIGTPLEDLRKLTSCCSTAVESYLTFCKKLNLTSPKAYAGDYFIDFLPFINDNVNIDVVASAAKKIRHSDTKHKAKSTPRNDEPEKT